MLARAAQRRGGAIRPYTRQQNQRVAAALNASWLYSAQLRCMGSSSIGTSSPGQPLASLRSDSASGRNTPNQVSSRSLGTAQLSSHGEASAYNPSIHNSQSASPSSSWTSLLPQHLRPGPLIIDHSLSIRPPKLLKIDGVGGDSDELHSNLHACLSVGRYTRAEACVRRLAEMFNADAPELVEAHNSYLRGLTNALAAGQADGVQTMKKIRFWYEVEMLKKGVAVNGTTYAIICRAAMIGLPRDGMVRTIRRYFHFAEQAGVLDEAVSSAELNDDEYNLLIELRHDIFSAEAMAEFHEEQLARHAAEQQNQQRPDWLQVKPVEQKGMGLESLKTSLVSIYNVDSVPFPYWREDLSDKEKHKLWQEMRQEKLEEDVVDVAIQRWKEEHEKMLKMGINTKLSSRSMEASLWQWQTALEAAIREEMVDVQKALNDPENKDTRRAELGPYLEAVKPEKMAGITILTVVQMCAKSLGEGSKTTYLSKKIGSYLEREAVAASATSGRKATWQTNKVKEEKRRMLLRRLNKTTPTTPKAKENDKAMFQPVEPGPWPINITLHIGALLLSKFLDTAMVPVRRVRGEDNDPEHIMEPAFQHAIEYERGKKIGKIRPQEQLRDKLMKTPLRASVGLSGHMPMLVRPRKWKGLSEGPYYRYSPLLVRHKDDDDVQVMYAKAASEKGHLDQVFAALDVLGKTAWRINRPVLQVMLEAWNSGEAIADLAPENPQAKDPLPELAADASAAEKRMWFGLMKERQNEVAGLHSQRCFTNLQLEVAKAYADKTFYYPHNIDFRGRAYPVPPFLNHMGADNARGLLTFDKGKPLGEAGLRWLKIHLSNLAGFDKASLDERVAFTEEHMDDIIDSANNALGGKRWWLEAEDPWQCLAACFELKAAMECADPTLFVSHIPVAQDGSCNGLQHYAALGGDTFGASQVNLEPGPRPADVYSGVAKLVKEAIVLDAETATDPAIREQARVLKDKITRKVVKQTVMTNVYGVTFVGARAQVQKQLDAMMQDQSETTFSNYQLGSYVAKKIFKALATMFEGAHNIQYWLGECADRITRAITPEQIKLIIDRQHGKEMVVRSKYKDAAWKYWAKRNAAKGIKSSGNGTSVQAVDFRTSVIWTTPMNLPVVQPYRAAKARFILTSVQRIDFKEPRAYDPVNRRRQLQAFPPNFVHSLDATHMLLSALKCDEAGLTFAAVHDSFWTHAADVSTMGEILRDAFIKMHKDDVIGRLKSEFEARYKGSLSLATVYAESPLGQRILALRKQIHEDAGKKAMGKEWKGSTLRTKTLQKELLEEWERQQLLASEDAEERARGEAMRTPGALFAEVTDMEDFKVPEVAPKRARATKSKAAKGRQDEDLAMEDVLDEHLDADAEAENMDADEADVEDELNAIEGEDKGVNIIAKLANRMNRKSGEKKIVVWAPLIFPALPKKGEFDVERVRESQYFFA